jgi:hypothetical protein
VIDTPEVIFETTVTESSSLVKEVVVFKSINYVYMRLGDAYTATNQGDGTITGITNPSSWFRETDIEFWSWVISDRFYVERVKHTIAHAG